MKNNEEKISRSVSMTKTVYDYVQRMEGKSFNDKFNRMVLFCMRREKILYEQMKDLEKKNAALKVEILKKETFLRNIDEIKQISIEMIEKIKKQ